MKCPECGNEIKDGETVCPSCGKALNETEDHNEIPAEEAERVKEESSVTEPEVAAAEDESPQNAGTEAEDQSEVSAEETADVTEDSEVTEPAPETEESAPANETEDQSEISPEQAVNAAEEPEKEIQAVVPAEVTTEESVPFPTEEKPKKKPFWKNLPLMILLAALFVGITFGLYVMTNREDPAEKVLNQYYTALNKMYDVGSAEELTNVYRDIYTMTIPDAGYYEMLKEWYGVESKDQLYSEMAMMNYPSIRDLDPELKNRVTFTWQISGTEKQTMEMVHESFFKGLEMYALDRNKVTDIRRFDVVLKDMTEEPVEAQQSVLVYQYDGKWYVMQ